MTADFIALVRVLFASVWSLFTGWYIPGTNVTPAAMGFFLLASGFILDIVKKNLFGGGDDG